MVVESCAGLEDVKAGANATELNARKRNASGQAVAAKHSRLDESAPVSGTDDKTRHLVTNNGWGDLFKSRENFVEMHLC